MTVLGGVASFCRTNQHGDIDHHFHVCLKIIKPKKFFVGIHLDLGEFPVKSTGLVRVKVPVVGAELLASVL